MSNKDTFSGDMTVTMFSFKHCFFRCFILILHIFDIYVIVKQTFWYLLAKQSYPKFSIKQTPKNLALIVFLIAYNRGREEDKNKQNNVIIFGLQ